MNNYADIKKIVPKIIRRLRTSKGLSQEDLANLAGLDRTYISGVERGVRNITLLTLSKILSAMSVDVISFAHEILREAVTIGENVPKK